MAGVDLTVYRFDYDLTFAALLMNADGTIYHTLGGRDWTDPTGYLSVDSFADVLRKTLREHESYARDPKPPPKREKRTIEMIPDMAERIRRKKAPECFHCHMVHGSRTRSLVARGRWHREMAWRWPDPVQAGLVLEKEDQSIVAEVRPRSAAARAGIRKGDRIRRMDGRSILTFSDVSRILHEATHGSTAIDVDWERDGALDSGRLRLESGWKEPLPLVFSWRASMWTLSPKPGFGGRRLTAAELSRLGLPADSFAFRVQYIVTWGDDAHTGRNARKAGIRKGDVVLAAGGRSDFRSVAHFHAWFRLTRRIGETVPLEVLRDGRRLSLRLAACE